MFTLFVASALLPVIAMTALTLWQSAARVDDVVSRQVHGQVRLVGYQLLARLEAEAQRLRLMAEALRGADAGERRARLAEGAGRWRLTAPEALPLSPALRQALARGRPALWTTDAPEWPIALGVMVDAGNVLSTRLGAGQLDPANDGWPWCVFGPRGRLIACAPGLSTAGRRMLAGAVVASRWPWYDTGHDHVYDAWPLFVRSAFAAAGDWLVVAGVPTAAVAPRAGAVARAAVLVAGLALALVTLLSSVTLRRNLVPVQQLIAATSRMAGGRLDTTVRIDSGDELQDLGEHFNAMGAALAAHVGMVELLAEVDRRILEGAEVGDLAALVIERRSAFLPAGRIVIGQLGDDGLRVWRSLPDGTAGPALLPLDPAARRRLMDASPTPRDQALLFDVDRPADVRLMVLTHRARAVGILATDGALDSGREEALRHVGARLAVAMGEAGWVEQLYRHTHYDELTALANRNMLRERLREACDHDPALRQPLALVVIHVDGIEEVAQAFGQAAADQAIVASARRIQHGAGERASVVARIGHATFALAVAEVPGRREANAADALTGLAAGVQRCIGEAVTIGGQQVTCTASVGIARFPEDAADADTLLERAEAALHQAGGEHGAVTWYAPEMSALAARRVALRAALDRALRDGELAPWFQPKVCTRSGRVTSAEALVRWQRPGEPPVPPGEFLPLAEEFGHIVPLGEQVLREACRLAARWDSCGIELEVAVNVAAEQFARTDLVTVVREALSESGLPASRLILELTESTLLDADQGMVSRMHALRGLGVGLSLDDFGTGYSSLSYLHRYPFSQVKVDRCFVERVVEDGRARAIVRSIRELSSALGLQVVAEGVETPAQQAVLTELGCDELQGYLISQPRPAEEFEAFVRRWNQGAGQRSRQRMTAAG